jgi:hypothetical protein
MAISEATANQFRVEEAWRPTVRRRFGRAWVFHSSFGKIICLR